MCTRVRARTAETATAGAPRVPPVRSVKGRETGARLAGPWAVAGPWPRDGHFITYGMSSQVGLQLKNKIIITFLMRRGECEIVALGGFCHRPCPSVRLYGRSLTLPHLPTSEQE